MFCQATPPAFQNGFDTLNGGYGAPDTLFGTFDRGIRRVCRCCERQCQQNTMHLTVAEEWTGATILVGVFSVS